VRRSRAGKARGKRWRTVVANAVLILGSLLVGLVAAELGLRVAGIGYGNSPVEASSRLRHERPRSYEFLADDPAGEYGGFMVRYDDSGHRVGDEAPKAADAERRIAFLGDSFTEGHTSAWNETFIGWFERANRDIVTRNYGVASYAALMYLIQAKQDLPAFRPTDVVLQLFANDFDDDHSTCRAHRARTSTRSNGSTVGRKISPSPCCAIPTWRDWYAAPSSRSPTCSHRGPTAWRKARAH
jgi:hypothetical protein